MSRDVSRFATARDNDLLARLLRDRAVEQGFACFGASVRPP